MNHFRVGWRGLLGVYEFHPHLRIEYARKAAPAGKGKFLNKARLELEV